MSRSTSRPRAIPNLAQELAEDYVDDTHIAAFAEALIAEDLENDPVLHDPNQPTTPLLSPGSGHGHGPRVRKISALSDFAPVNIKVKRRKKSHKAHHKRHDWLFYLFRWPLLFFIFLVIGAEFGFYVFIRQAVNAKEWVTSWWGRKGLYRSRLRAAKTYEEWKAAARTLDEYLGFEEWKTIDEDPYFDWRLVKKVLRSLRTLRPQNDIRGVLGVLETCIRNNFAGIESQRIYSETYYGSKNLVEAYIDEVECALRYIRESPDLSNDEKRRFFKCTNTNLGVSALCLSGGASFGYYHFGVVKAFVDANLLPRVITGTSAGGLVAALVCTRTDEELRLLLVPELANKITACEEAFNVWFSRFLKVGARFDSVAWARKSCFFTRGSLTFKEAYLRTGRILNISVIPADQHSPTKLLNYMTAPDTVIWSALIASAAVPGILNPVVLMQKLKDGRIVPWNWGSKFKDGSLRVDIPLQSLNLYFNVTNPIVSQVNPHVHLFFFSPRGSPGKPVIHSKGKSWRGNFLLSAAEQWLKLELTKNFKLLRDLELLPQLLGQDWSSVFLQRFDGSVTIWPRTRINDWIRILSDPDPPELARMISVGQYVAWPKLHMIANRTRLERSIFEGRQAVRINLQKPLLPDDRASKPGSIHVEPLDVTTAQPGTRELLAPQTVEPDGPLSVDTDVENAFNNGSERFFKRSHHRHHARNTDESSQRPSGISTPRDLSIDGHADPLRSAARRRKWASKLLYDSPQPGTDNEALETNTPQGQAVGETQEAQNRTSDEDKPPTFLSRLRTSSLTSIAGPFSSLRRRASKLSIAGPTTVRGVAKPEQYWSSETSSSDNDIPWKVRRPIRQGSFSHPVDNEDEHEHGMD